MARLLNGMLRGLGRRAKPFVDEVGLGAILRQLYVELLRSGERVRFAFVGPPDPSTTILLVGSGRSGTTWLADLICAIPGIQQIFEPLHPLWNVAVQRLVDWDINWQEETSRFRGIYLRPHGHYPEWHELLERILTGQFRNYWTDYERTSFFPQRFLVKEIRFNLMLGYIYEHFRPRIVFMVRHPCAVVYSRLSLAWRADVRDILAQEALVEDHLRAWVKDIEKAKDPLDAHAIWWAVENLVASRHLAQRPRFALHYEHLVLNPEEVLRQVSSWLGLEARRSRVNASEKESRMSNPQVQYKSRLERLERWRHALSQEEQNRILGWVHRFGLEWYDSDILPVQPLARGV